MTRGHSKRRPCSRFACTAGASVSTGVQAEGPMMCRTNDVGFWQKHISQTVTILQLLSFWMIALVAVAVASHEICMPGDGTMAHQTKQIVGCTVYCDINVNQRRSRAFMQASSHTAGTC